PLPPMTVSGPTPRQPLLHLSRIALHLLPFPVRRSRLSDLMRPLNTARLNFRTRHPRLQCLPSGHLILHLFIAPHSATSSIVDHPGPSRESFPASHIRISETVAVCLGQTPLLLPLLSGCCCTCFSCCNPRSGSHS